MPTFGANRWDGWEILLKEKKLPCLRRVSYPCFPL